MNSLCTDDISLVSKDEALKRALTYWNRAAAQGLQVTYYVNDDHTDQLQACLLC